MNARDTWFISDLHLAHSNIIAYCNRPFKSVEEMNSVIIENINNTVKKTSTLWVLGDFCLGGFDEMCDFTSRIACENKRLVMGNHDRLKVEQYYEAGWKFVSPYPILIGKYIWLSHAPVFLMSGSPIINLHGHVHNTLPHRPSEQYWNLSAEVVEYKPISLYSIYADVESNGGHPTE